MVKNKFFFIILVTICVFCSDFANAEDIITAKAKRINYLKKTGQSYKIDQSIEQKNLTNKTKREIFIEKKNEDKKREQEELKKKDEELKNENDIDKKIEKYFLHLNDSKITTYLNVGFGTTGAYINASFYYLNLIGVRAEYDFFPHINIDYFSKLLTDSDKINNREYTVGVGVKHSFGVDVSIRPLTLVSRSLSGFRIDVGLRYLRGNVSINVEQDMDLIDTLDKEIDKINDRSLLKQISKGKEEFIEISTNGVNFMLFKFLKQHGLDLTLFYRGYVVMNFDIYFSNGLKPYIGLGWDINLSKGFDLSFSLGVIITQWKLQGVTLYYKDKTTDYYRDALYQHFVDLDIEKGLIAKTLLSSYDKVISNVINKNSNNINNIINSLGKLSRIWPVVQIGFGWQFDV